MMRIFASGLLAVLATVASARGDSSVFLNLPVANAVAGLQSVNALAMVETGSTGCEADFEDLGSYLVWHVWNKTPYLVMHNDNSPPHVGIRSLAEWSTIAEIRNLRFTFKKNIHTQQYVIHRMGDANKRIVVKRSADSNGRFFVEFHGPDFDPAVWQDNFILRQSTQKHHNVSLFFFTMQILKTDNTVVDIALQLHADHKKLYGIARQTTSSYMAFMLGNRLGGLKGEGEISVKDIIMIESKYYNGWVGTKTNNDHMGARSRSLSSAADWHEFVDITRNDANSGNSDSFKLTNLEHGNKLLYRSEGYNNWKTGDLLKYKGSGNEVRMLVSKVNNDDNWWKWSRKDSSSFWMDNSGSEWVVWADGSGWSDNDKFMFYRYYYDPTAKIRITAANWT